METAKIAKGLTGDKLYQERARRALPLLVRQAHGERSITYENLASELGMSNPRNLNYVLGSIGRALKKASKYWEEEIPPIQCLVVKKSTGIPGEGISGFLKTHGNYRKSSRKQRRKIIDKELIRIYGYSKWLAVLKLFKLKPVKEDFSRLISKASERLGGGESPEHKRLKSYVAAHPGVLGLPNNMAPGIEEHRLPSGDSIDVFFINGGEHIGVEIKPSSCDSIELTRGLYQCIKYQAVLEASQAATGKPQNVRTLLVLAGQLPDELLSLKNVLGVEVIEKVKPK